MNISTYESQINALEAGGGGGGGTGDGAFIITIDFQNVTSDKTFSEVKNAVLNKAFIVTNIGGVNTIPNIEYVDAETDIIIDVTMFTPRTKPTPLGVINIASFILHPDDSMEVGTMEIYNFTITEVTP